jgi:uncharacterized membrane-anchored protein
MNKFLIGISVQVFILLALIFFQALPIARGTTIILSVRPVDPTDPLRGDYLTFEYDISRLKPTLARLTPVQSGDKIYVELAKSGRIWVPIGIYKQYPNTSQVVLSGRVISAYPNSEIHVTYGIEQYFVPQGKGQSRAISREPMTAKVSVSPNGQGYIRQLFVGQNPWP